jgi:FtsP/CotA-like multicopper oxidase with cupredoxin domain
MGGHMMGGTVSADGIEWEDSPMNTMPMASMMKWMLTDDATGRSNEKLVYTAKVGDKVKIRIVNKQAGMHPMQHPIHFHGQRFLVLSENGVKNEHLVWKDTVLVPAGHTVDILLDISNPGDWMFHCHIAEHLGNGMMGMLRVQ